MIQINHLKTVIYKSFKDLMVNQVALILSFIFPVMVGLFSIAFPPEEAFEPIASFAMLNIMMIPIIVISSMIAEEKEKGTLKVLVICNVSPVEYLIGIALSTFLTSFTSAVLFMLLVLEYIVNTPKYLIYTVLGLICSVLIGAVIGILCDTQVKVGAIAAPVSMILAMLSVFGEVNPAIKEVDRWLYAGILSGIVAHNERPIQPIEIVVFIVNVLVLGGIFYWVYSKRQLLKK